MWLWLRWWSTKTKISPLVLSFVCFPCVLKLVKGSLHEDSCFLVISALSLLSMFGQSGITVLISQTNFKEHHTFIVFILGFRFLHSPVTQHYHLVSFSAFTLLSDQKRNNWLTGSLTSRQILPQCACDGQIVWFFHLLLCTCVSDSFLCFHVFAPGLQKEPTVCLEMLQHHFLSVCLVVTGLSDRCLLGSEESYRLKIICCFTEKWL